MSTMLLGDDELEHLRQARGSSAQCIWRTWKRAGGRLASTHAMRVVAMGSTTRAVKEKHREEHEGGAPSSYARAEAFVCAV